MTPTNIYEALVTLRQLHEYCETRISLGMGNPIKPADEAVILCRILEDALLRQLAREREHPGPLPSQKEHIP